MILKRYKVENFRSVQDSGWIDCDNVTTFVGINESGKSNLLLALWKLNPARDGRIDILHDMPVTKLSTLRKTPERIVFITADFQLEDNDIEQIESKVKCSVQKDALVRVSRYYDGHFTVDFPGGKPALKEPEAVIENENGRGLSEGEKVTSYEEKDLESAVQRELPKFVYYSNYGNLSSKIYLPNVIKWLNGETVPGIDINEEQVRTLRVLFEFVNLDPKEILELGKDPKDMAIIRNGRNGNTQPTIDEIKKAEDDKEERSILLQSASGDLTKKFKEWWKQGEYKFRFEADGDYFRIWVADGLRPDEVGLELRSTGLQWFLSFYLIFLVESQGQNKDSILLLDEAGLTLHPLAQKDLAKFFDALSNNNQLINTTHSPFIVDTSNIDRCRVVYIAKDGYTVASSNLRQGSDSLNEKSIYAVHAALGLSVSDILLQGCQPIIVEGPTDQFYLNAIKSFLIKEKLISPEREIVFVPSGGVKGISGVVSILSSKGDGMPYLILDSDKNGEDGKKKLLSGLYKGYEKMVLSIKDFTKIEGSEIEDLIPFQLNKKGIDKIFNPLTEIEFEGCYENNRPIVPQIELFAQKNGIELGKDWKVGLAITTKTQLRNKKKDEIQVDYLQKWEKLFTTFLLK
jgi:predicted ATPase/5S rRNA maturation endonuclease (ribonuclease M5)